MMKHNLSAEQKHKFLRNHYGQDGALSEEEGTGKRYMFGDSGNRSSTELMVYKDKDGLPVTYDAAARDKKKHATADDLSVLWHEILSPLTVIKGYTGTLLELNESITEEQKKQYLRGIESASNRMIHLLENLRDISHLENSDTWITHSVYLNDLLRRVIPEMQSQTNKHVIKITPVERLPLVKAEPEKLEQVLTNIITNAIKYSPQGGEITVDVRLVRDEHDLNTMFRDAPAVSFPSLVVSITDDGIGVPEEELESIFQRFYRVNNQIIKSTPGAGLGLYISQIIVEGHGGRIWASNRSQGGSVFNFSLPLEQRATRRYKDYH
jgi:two-component system sensor histidine kinase VicK